MEEDKRKARMEKRAIIRTEFEQLAPIGKTFSKRKLPLISPIKPHINKWLQNPEVVYHRSKEPDWLAPALERQREEMLAVPGIERKKVASFYDNVDVLYMPDDIRNDVQIREGLKDEVEINKMYEAIMAESKARRKAAKLAAIALQETSENYDDDGPSLDNEEASYMSKSVTSSL